MGPRSFSLVPSFDDAYWRSVEWRRFRDFAGFAKKKGHLEPDSFSTSANHWAAELAREECAEEVRRVYENAVVILGLRRSAMERTDVSLATPRFRFEVVATQDEEDPRRVRVARELRIEMPLDELPDAFDDLLPYRPDELVVPVAGVLEKRAVLIALEDWEHALRARLSESVNAQEYKLRMPSGFSIRVDLHRRETVFEQENISGVLKLGPAVKREIRALGIKQRLS
jgi:hypothetical protein